VSKASKTTLLAIPRLPYVSFSAFRNFLSECSWSGMPAMLDRSAFPNMTPSLRSQLLPSLRAMALLEDIQPTPALKQLIAAWGRRSFPIVLDPILRETYDFMEGVDLLAITPTQLAESFEAAGYAASVQTRAVTFFLNAATAAGWPVGPRLSFGRKNPSKGGSLDAHVSLKRQSRGSGAEGSRRLALTEKFPDCDPAWSARERASWYRHLSETIRAVNG
jgi:hypothetical protein